MGGEVQQLGPAISVPSATSRNWLLPSASYSRKKK